ncbi:hypothetical protein E2C01_011396 [Portunus trituberculatus]|uniref:Uncharacterized protein n=1 Tax=Portunus trituberculatus TaxID=210409 RepID=A0A5B7DB36_PORTR|nr:hypothetical protein [Portunus trituberculatus]
MRWIIRSPKTDDAGHHASQDSHAHLSYRHSNVSPSLYRRTTTQPPLYRHDAIPVPPHRHPCTAAPLPYTVTPPLLYRQTATPVPPSRHPCTGRTPPVYPHTATPEPPHHHSSTATPPSLYRRTATPEPPHRRPSKECSQVDIFSSVPQPLYHSSCPTTHTSLHPLLPFLSSSHPPPFIQPFSIWPPFPPFLPSLPSLRDVAALPQTAPDNHESGSSPPGQVTLLTPARPAYLSTFSTFCPLVTASQTTASPPSTLAPAHTRMHTQT